MASSLFRPTCTHHWVVNIVILQLVLSTVVLSSSAPRKVSTTKLQNDGSLDTYYMTKHCREMWWSYVIDKAYVFIDNQAYLMAQPLDEIERSPMYVTLERCVATFAAPPGYRLLLHFQDLAIDFRTQYSSRLHIYNGDTPEKRMSPYHGLYGETKSQSSNSGLTSNLVVKDYVSTGQQALTLMFDGVLSKRFYGFKALLTPVKRPITKNGTCPSGMFRCVANWYCLDSALVCNGISNCGEGDRSDEGRQCNAKAYQLTSSSLDDLGLMIGCGVSILILLMAVIWVGVMCQRRLQSVRRQRQQLEEPERSWRPVEEGVPEAAAENSRWIPRSLYNSVSPWLCRKAAPAYSESAPSMDPTGQFEPPPPYNDINENRSLIPNAPPRSPEAIGDDVGLRASIIANPSAPCISLYEHPGYRPPSYEESNIAANRLMHPQPIPAILRNAPEPTQPQGNETPKNESSTVKPDREASHDPVQDDIQVRNETNADQDQKFPDA